MEEDPLAPPPVIVEPGDYYLEGPNLVFTSAYLLRRGSCCGSGCRHCPYGHGKGTAGGDGAERPADQ